MNKQSRLRGYDCKKMVLLSCVYFSLSFSPLHLVCTQFVHKWFASSPVLCLSAYLYVCMWNYTFCRNCWIPPFLPHLLSIRVLICGRIVFRFSSIYSNLRLFHIIHLLLSSLWLYAVCAWISHKFPLYIISFLFYFDIVLLDSIVLKDDAAVYVGHFCELLMLFLPWKNTQTEFFFAMKSITSISVESTFFERTFFRNGTFLTH